MIFMKGYRVFWEIEALQSSKTCTFFGKKMEVHGGTLVGYLKPGRSLTEDDLDLWAHWRGSWGLVLGKCGIYSVCFLEELRWEWIDLLMYMLVRDSSKHC